MSIRSVFATCVVIGSTVGGGYTAVSFRNVPGEVPRDEVQRILEEQAGEYEERIYELKKEIPSKDVLMSAKAISNYGHANVVALAMNGANECPSSQLTMDYHRCSPLEEAAIMYATLNLLKLGENGDTIQRVVYAKTGRSGKTPMFSWTVKKNPRSPNSKSERDLEIFNNSFEMAAHILGGGTKYEQADYGQFYFCNKAASRKNCKGHEDNKNYVPMGRFNLSPEEVKMPLMLDKWLSKHHFYGLTEEYKQSRGITQ